MQFAVTDAGQVFNVSSAAASKVKDLIARE